MTASMLQAKNVHLIGIGGIGTSAAAKWWLAQGATVTGSDAYHSDLTKTLETRGITVKYGHAPDNIPTDCDLVIYSRAVPEINPERQAVKERGLIEWSYPQFLGELSRMHKTIAISGTNGKSTTTAMTAKILIDAGLDPTVIMGTLAPFLPEGNLLVGAGEWLVVEACEHMESMRQITPHVAVITNIEADHLDYYGTVEKIQMAFESWITETKPLVTFLNHRDPRSQKIDGHFFDVTNRSIENGQQIFQLVCNGPLNDVRLSLRLPGEFNAMNAAAAAHAGIAAEVDVEVIKSALADFPGTWRRFEYVGAWQGADVYSDYAHHPIGICGTLQAFKEFFPARRLVVVFEPHQHSRTHELFADFVTSFDQADVLILSEVYEVTGRTEEKFESSVDLVAAVKSRGTIDHVIYAADHAAAENVLRDLVESGDVVVIMGAGSIDELARKLT